MVNEIAGQRPAVLSGSSRNALDEYRAFRHMVRNVYTFNLDAAKVGHLMALAPSVFRQVHAELAAFATFLEQQAEADQHEPPSGR